MTEKPPPTDLAVVAALRGGLASSFDVETGYVHWISLAADAIERLTLERDRLRAEAERLREAEAVLTCLANTDPSQWRSKAEIHAELGRWRKALEGS